MKDKEFVPYEEALALKELGFDELCFSGYEEGKLDDNIFRKNSDFNKSNKYYNVICSAPLYQQAFRWFREKYNLWIEIKVEDNVRLGEQKFYWSIFGEYTSFEGNPWIRAKVDSNGIYYENYEEAELACLRKLIEIVNQNKDE